MSISNQDLYLDLRGLSKYSSLAIPTLRDHLKNSCYPIPHYKVKGKILVLKSEFDYWIKQFRVDREDIQEHVTAALKGLKLT